MDDRVLERRDSHASSAHEVSLEPTPARSVVLSSSTSTPMAPSSQEIDHSDHHPAIESSESVDRQARGHPHTSETPEELFNEPIPKPNKNEDNEQVQGSPYSDIPEWLQEFRENMKEFLNTRTHKRFFSRMIFRTCVKCGFGKAQYLHSLPERPKLRGPKKSQGPCAEDALAGAVPRAENFGDLITADHKVLSDNCESRNNHRDAVVVQDLATQWIQAYPCKNKTSRNPGKLAKVPGIREETKSHLH